MASPNLFLHYTVYAYKLQVFEGWYAQKLYLRGTGMPNVKPNIRMSPQKWQAGQGGTHLAFLLQFPSGQFRKMLVGEGSPIPTERPQKWGRLRVLADA